MRGGGCLFTSPSHPHPSRSYRIISNLSLRKVETYLIHTVGEWVTTEEILRPFRNQTIFGNFRFIDDHNTLHEF
jgi:hypothetical protein